MTAEKASPIVPKKDRNEKDRSGTSITMLAIVSLPLRTILKHVNSGSWPTSLSWKSIAVSVTLCNVGFNWRLFWKTNVFPVNHTIESWLKCLFCLYESWAPVVMLYSSHCGLAVVTILSSACSSLPNTVHPVSSSLNQLESPRVWLVLFSCPFYNHCLMLDLNNHCPQVNTVDTVWVRSGKFSVNKYSLSRQFRFRLFFYGKCTKVPT